MKKIRLVLIGLGNIGQVHANNLLGDAVPRLELAAVVDSDPSRLALYPQVRGFTSLQDALDSDSVDAALIATPHRFHVDQAIAALDAGLHVLIEKPVAPQKAECERLIAAHRGREQQICAAMFNQRTDGFHRKIRELIIGGDLSDIRRINWIVTNWFRPEAYYASGGWRATWAGEGGGVLFNQCPHNLDLFQWLFGMPRRVRAFCRFGRYHAIEVEDDVTAYLEFADGSSAVFITSTGEAPGTNRLEITAERGRLVYENDALRFTRNEIPMSDFSRNSSGAFGRPSTWDISIPAAGHGRQHVEIMENFAAAILDGVPLIAPAAEGMHSVELANAMLMSTWLDATIELPIDSTDYSMLLAEKIALAPRRPSRPTAPVADMRASFQS